MAKAKTRVLDKPQAASSVAQQPTEVAELKQIFQRVDLAQGQAHAKGLTYNKKQPAFAVLSLSDGRTITVNYGLKGRIETLTFSDGRVLTTTDGGEYYLDNLQPDVKLKNLKLDMNDGELCYKTTFGKRSAQIKESSNGAKYATLKEKGDAREFQLLPDRSQVVIGKEGKMIFSADGNYLTMEPKSGGQIKFHLWNKMLDVVFPDGYEQSFYATEKEMKLLQLQPIGFYINWLPADDLGRHFEWGVVLPQAVH